MKALPLLFLALGLCAQAPTITDAQRIEYREMERDYFRTELQIVGLRLKSDELQQKLAARHQVFVQSCAGAALDESRLACKEKP